MGDLHTIRLSLDEVGRGKFFIDDVEINGVAGVEIEIHPSQRFNMVKFTVIGQLEAEIAVDDSGVAFAELVARAGGADDSPPAIPAD